MEVETEEYPNLPVVLVADNAYYNFTRKLGPEDEVRFTGSITGSEDGIVSSTMPRIDLTSIACVSCSDTELNESANENDSLSSYVYNYVKYLLNFLFNPLIVFK